MLNIRTSKNLFIYLLPVLLLLGNVANATASTEKNSASSERGVSTVLFEEDFSGFTGGGFAPMPAAGQLDSDVYRLTGFSDGEGSFSGTHGTGDFARGTSTGGVSTGGAYAFTVDAGNAAFGVQPGSTDFTPGSFDLQVVNTTGDTITNLDIDYLIYVFNNEDRSNSLNFSWSLDDVTYTEISALDFVSTGVEDASPTWVSVPRTASLTSLNLPAASSIFLRWTGDDESGGGSRDEFAIDDIVVTIPPPVEIVVGKSGPAIALPGDQLTYSISISNPSTTDELSSLIVTDQLPSGLTFVSQDSAVIPTFPTTDSIQWDFGTLAASDSISFDLVVDSAAGIAPGSVLTNTITVEAVLNAVPVQETASVDTTFLELVTIQQIQQVNNPDADDASPRLGQTVIVEGIVTAAPGEFDSDTFLTIQNAAGGAWSGLVVTGDFSSLTIERGNQLSVVGEVQEPNGLTVLSSDRVEIIGQTAVPAPEILAASAFPEGVPDSAEQWEAVLIEFQNVEVTETLSFGEWRFDDTSGITRGDDFGSLSFSPTAGDEYDFLRGIGWFSFSNYKVQPRNNADIEFVAEAFEIFTIQGEGLRSLFAPATGNGLGQVVSTLDNVVTAVAENGFFIQTPDDRDSSSLPLASRGLFVFTGSAPTVSVGDRVDVTGAVAEFFDFTQIAQPDSIELVSAGNPLPTAVVLDGTMPSPDPQALSCGDTQFECYEGMLATVANGFVTAPSQSFGSDPVAEAFISADGARILRGKGEAFPGIAGCPGCPVWSGAPELFEIDPDRFNVQTEPLAGGTLFNATGVIGFSFGDFALWPTELNITSEPTLPDPVPDFGPAAFTIGSLNALNFFDDELGAARPITVCGSTDDAIDREVLNTNDYETKLNKLAVYIVTGLGRPDVLAMQEVESEQVLQDLADEIALIDASLVYTPRLLPGNDRGNINNGYLINAARIIIDSIELAAEEECLTVDNSPLHDRPPLLLRARFTADGNDVAFAVYNNHMRSLGGVSNADGRTRLKRHEQAQSVATLVQALQTTEPDLPILVIGDINAFEFTDGYADVVGHLRGTANPSENFVSLENAGQPGFDDSNITSPTLRLPLAELPLAERYSFIFQGVSQTLDHALLDNSAWQLFEDLSYSRANADYWDEFEFDVSTEARGSDHDGLVVTLSTNRIFSDGFESD